MQDFIAVVQRVSICHSIFSFFCVLSPPESPLLLFQQLRFCETVVRTLEELPCTSVHVLDVCVPCENSGQRIPLPGPMQRQLVLFHFHLLACFQPALAVSVHRCWVVCVGVRAVERFAHFLAPLVETLALGGVAMQLALSSYARASGVYKGREVLLAIVLL